MGVKGSGELRFPDHSNESTGQDITEEFGPDGSGEVKLKKNSYTIGSQEYFFKIPNELKDKKMEFEGIDTIQIEDLDLILSNKNDETHHSSRENLWFDKDLLKRNLEELIYDLN